MLQTAAEPPKEIFYGSFAPEFSVPLLLGVTERGVLCLSSFLAKQRERTVVASWHALWPQTAFHRRNEPFRRAPENFLLVGTPFQQRVWRALTRIPAGKTLSYGELAARVGHPGAARAVGHALGANPIPFFVPCHRVIAADGTIGGFSSDLDIKRTLLKREGAFIRE